MYTSYFAKYRGEHGVAVAGKVPVGFTGRHYPKLAPKYWFFQKYKQDKDQAHYTECYKREVLAPLNARVVHEELGPNAVLLCYEKPGDFCHRRLIADWFEQELGVLVKEL